ncbi:MAG TPA: VWA domain-containing protein [Candidatus Saccharimonadales bacterium]|nr:VWA domain-containing protein [Candidatus Saccharimonadales bacterium]
MAQDPVKRAPLKVLLAGLLAAACLVIFSSAVTAQTGGTTDDDEPLLHGYVDRLEVSLVLLQATVVDRKGAVVNGLTPADFKLYEEDEPQKISVFGTSMDQPLQVAFLLDVSGSMGLRGKFKMARESITRFVAHLRVDDQLALLTFADGSVVVKKGFTEDRNLFFKALNSMAPWGRTALRDALAHAPGILMGAAPGRKALVLVTDGVDNASEMTVLEAIQTARAVPVPIFTIALSDLPAGMHEEIRPDSGGRSFFEVLQAFGHETGGTLMPVFSPADMNAAISLIDSRLRGQYIIGYRPTDSAEPGSFRRVTLETTDKHLRVITRTGYYASR